MSSNLLSAYTNIAIKDVIGKPVSHEFKVTDLSYNNILVMEELFNTLSKISSKLMPWHDKKGTAVYLEQKNGTECLFVRGINAGLNSRFARERANYMKKPSAPVKLLQPDLEENELKSILTRIDSLEKRMDDIENK